MNIRLFTLWLLLMAATRVAFASNQITLSGTEGSPGDTIEVAVLLESDFRSSGLQLTLTLPQGSEYVADSAEPMGRAEVMSASGGMRDGRLNLVLYSLSGEKIDAGSGDVLHFRLSLGDTPMRADLSPQAILVGDDGSSMTVNCPAAYLTIDGAALTLSQNEYTLGRVALGESRSCYVSVTNTGTQPLVITGVNGDSDFSVAQQVSVASGSTAQVQLTFVPSHRGVNDAILRLESNADGAPQPMIFHYEGYGRNEVFLSAPQAIGGEEVTVSVNLKNYDPICGFTLTLDLPRGYSYVPGSLEIADARDDGHGVTYSVAEGTNGQSTVTLTAYSLSNKAFKDHDGVVAQLRLLVASRSGATISVKQAVLPAVIDGEVMDVVSSTSGVYVSVKSPNLNVTRSQNLGRTPLTQTAVGTMTLRNNGNMPLVITGIECAEELTPEIEFPITVATYKSIGIPFTLTGVERGTLTRTIILNCNDPETPQLSVDLSMERYAPNELTIAGEETDEGEPLVLTLAMDNYDCVEAIQFDLIYPASLDCDVDGLVLSRSADYSVSTYQIEPGRSRVMLFSFGGASIASGQGDLLDLILMPENGTDVGSYSFSVENVVIGMDMNSNVYSANIHPTATVNVVALQPGDLNGDKKVALSDLNLMLAYLVSPEATAVRHRGADYDRNGSIDGIDLDLLVEEILANSVVDDLAEQTGWHINVPDVQIDDDGNGTAEVYLEMDGEDCGSLMFDLQLPEGVSLLHEGEGQYQFELNPSLDHVMVTADLATNKIRAIVYSPAGMSINPGDEALFTFGLVADEEYSESAAATVSKINMAYGSDMASAMDYKLDDVNFQVIPRKQASDIDEVLAEADSYTVYNLHGIELLRNATAAQVKALRSGVYVVNGTKLLIK